MESNELANIAARHGIVYKLIEAPNMTQDDAANNCVIFFPFSKGGNVGHYCACFGGHFFDSYGRAFNDIVPYKLPDIKFIDYNADKLQNINSRVCGLYSICRLKYSNVPNPAFISIVRSFCRLYDMRADTVISAWAAL